MNHIWIRAEERPFERRVGISPEGASELLQKGFLVTIEKSDSRIIPLEAYLKEGCLSAEAGSWVDAPKECIIFGLKELASEPELCHRHIMFGHCYKDQPDRKNILNRFKKGGGMLYDLEYLVNNQNKRIAAFGYWAGFAGAAVGLKIWLAQKSKLKVEHLVIDDVASKDLLCYNLKKQLNKLIISGVDSPLVMVMGALGRVGSGALAMLNEMEIKCTQWDLKETSNGGPFPEILLHDIFINCVLTCSETPVFLNKEILEKERNLSVVSDVSCDPGSPYNPIPLYSSSHSFENPSIRVSLEPAPLDITAIDNLPSMLPKESSEDFSRQILPYLLEYDGKHRNVWARSKNVFNYNINNL